MGRNNICFVHQPSTGSASAKQYGREGRCFTRVVYLLSAIEVGKSTIYAPRTDHDLSI